MANRRAQNYEKVWEAQIFHCLDRMQPVYLYTLAPAETFFPLWVTHRNTLGGVGFTDPYGGHSTEDDPRE
jgi:hypothetical protein